MALTIIDIINHTNVKLENWYKNAKLDYNVDGSGVASYNAEEKKVIVEYTENGETNMWSMYYIPEYATTHNINWVFDCWSELA